MAKIDTSDLTTQEKRAGQKAARTIRRNLKLQLASLKNTGVQLQNIGVSVNMKFEQLNALTIRATDATFKQHYGFEGIKKNGARMRMKAFNHFEAIEKNNVLDRLIDEIGEIRATEITRNIRF